MATTFGRPVIHKLTGVGRFAIGLTATLLIVLLVVASQLEPSPAGHGTHTQLGLSRCFLYSQWGVRCPSCGMTTAWARLLNGNVVGAVAANSAGFLLALLAMVAAPWMLASSLIGRWWYCRPHAGLVLTLFAAVTLVAVFDWMRHTGLPLLLDSSVIVHFLPAS